MLLDLSIKELAEKLKSKEISPDDLVSESFSAIEKHENNIHAGITFVSRARATGNLPGRQAGGQQGTLLSGIPYVMKDAYVTRDIRTTAASKVLDNFIPPYSATVYKRLQDTGSILIGKMNMDAWGHGGSTENTDYAITRNPWDTTRSAGGSGGGPAAAIACGYASFAIGEDTGGSIRNPAAWNNITAMKVTYGRVSRYGAIPYASSFDTVGPTAKTVEDCAIVLSEIAGHDPYDATSSQKPVDDYLAINKPVKNKKIAIPKEFLHEGTDKEINNAIRQAIKQFEKLGILVEEISLPIIEYGVPLYYILVPSETSSNLGRYDGIRFGNDRSHFTKETMRRIMTGTYALSSGYYDAYYKKAQKARSVFIEKYKEVLKTYDAILSPVTPGLPAKFGELINDPIKNMLADIFTVTVNIVGLPALSLPCGFSQNKLPIGMQLIGNMFDEKNLFQLGYAYQQNTNWHTRRPKL